MKLFDILSSNIHNFTKFLLQEIKRRMASEFVGKVTEKELEESFQKIKETYISQAEEVFEKFGRYLKKNIFLIPPNVVLPEDKGKFDFTKYLMKTQK